MMDLDRRVCERRRVAVEILPYDAGRHEAETARALGAAFADDPAIQYLLGKRDLRGSQWCMRQGVRLAIAHGIGFVACEGGRVLGGSFWVPPGVSPLGSTIHQLKIGGWEAPFFLGVGGTARELWREEDLAKRFAKHLATPSWYLDLLGVDPAAQGKGLGKTLVASMLERADREAVGVVLVTHKKSNVDYYRCLGFEVLSDETLRGIPTGWTMRREPRAS
ncbi:MAG: GNAT family N-acetyltransferase [Deltaproteobacteria bacterium]|nr:GNAT family N-acetyltransferase [Deltaproteobacteria bacterium]